MHKGLKVNRQIYVPFESKAFDESGGFEGYASVFGVQDYDGDVIVRGAFKNTLQKFREESRMPKMLWQHRPDMICGKWTEMQEDDRGLYVKGYCILEVEEGRKAYSLMKAGVLDGMSIGFNIVDGGRDERGRVISEVDLWEVSLVTWGANPEVLVTRVKARESIRDFEAFLRDAGFSRNEAKALAADGYKALKQRDADEDCLDAEMVERLQNLTKLLKD